MPQAVKLLVKFDVEDGKVTSEEGAQRIKKAEAQAAFAEAEVKNDFPHLHATAVVALWTALECLIRDVLAVWLANAPSQVRTESLKKLRVPYLEYESIPADERPPYIAETIERELDIPLKQGVDRFEHLLAVAGLTGRVPKRLKTTLFEMAHVRNCIVHRGRTVDRRLATACPWLKLKVGDRLKVGHGNYVRYRDAVEAYAMECIQRAGERTGIPRDGLRLQAVIERLSRVRRPKKKASVPG